MKLFGRESPKSEPVVPQRTRVYVVGDIHGRADLLRDIHAQIQKDFSRAPVERALAVYLGDYVDRGLDSRQVIDVLLDEPLTGIESVYLRGNHEDFLLRFLDDPAIGASWMANGGSATIYSYVGGRVDLNDLTGVQAALRAALPGRHLEFLRSLQLLHVEGDYLFVHAGIRPNVPLEKQNPMDLMWIREDFLNSRARHAKMVVHGHSIRNTPDVRTNRIGIDTGAYATGILTCLVLQGGRRDFLHTV